MLARAVSSPQQQQQQQQHLDDHKSSTATPQSAKAKSRRASASMLLSDLYKAPKSTLSRLRHASQHATAAAAASSVLELHPDFPPDLLSKDRAKQKEAVKKYLAEKVRNDWVFEWPPTAATEGSKCASITEKANEEATEQEEKPAVAEAVNAGVVAEERAPPSQAEKTLPVEEPTSTGPADVAPQAAPEDSDDAESDLSSIYSTVSEDEQHFRPRAEWISDLTDDDSDFPVPAPSPFRFDTPDSVGRAVKATANAKKARRRKLLREEGKWNPGLACFTARRDAWTCARTVRVRRKAVSPASPSSPRRLSLFWRHSSTAAAANSLPSTSPPSLTSPLSPTSTKQSGAGFRKSNDGHTSTTTSEPDPKSPLTPAHTRDSKLTGLSRRSTQDRHAVSSMYPVETLLPIPHPILPPANPMRASITPALYPSLYDKVVVNGLQPTCPINLADMTRALVVGWKRDGEWPPRPEILPPAAAVVVVRSKKKKKDTAAATNANANANTAAECKGGDDKDAKYGRRGSWALKTGRRMSLGFLNRSDPDKDKEKEREKDKSDDKEKENQREKSDEHAATKGIRQSLQRVLGLGQGHANGNSNGHSHGHVHGHGAVAEEQQITIRA